MSMACSKIFDSSQLLTRLNDSLLACHSRPSAIWFCLTLLSWFSLISFYELDDPTILTILLIFTLSHSLVSMFLLTWIPFPRIVLPVLSPMSRKFTYTKIKFICPLIHKQFPYLPRAKNFSGFLYHLPFYTSLMVLLPSTLYYTF